MSKQAEPIHTLNRWKAARRFAPLALFVIVAVLIECVVVLYAVSSGIEDPSLLQWHFMIPGTNFGLLLSISPMFHLVPIIVVLTLTSVWTYLTRIVSLGSVEKKQGMHPSWRKRVRGKRAAELRSGTPRSARFMSLIRKTRLSRATARSTLIVFLVFLLFAVVISLLAYPGLIYDTIKGIYQSNPDLLSFVKGTGAVLASVGSAFSPLNEALLSASPGFENLVRAFGSITFPLASLDNPGKYLALQNLAAWFSAMVALLYGRFGRRLSRYNKR